MYFSQRNILGVLLVLTCIACGAQPSLSEFDRSPGDLHFDRLPTVWDEGVPLGNGMVGTLVWEKDGRLRLSLDRADLWDLRPMENLNTPEWKYRWVKEQWEKNDYKPVQEKFDVPYDRSPAPSKIPGAALEFDISSLGEVQSVHLYVREAVCEIIWSSGVQFHAFVHATDPLGWYRFSGLDAPLAHELIPPAYNLAGQSEAENPVTGQDLRRLGYPPGEVVQSQNSTTYNQEGWGGFSYQVHVGDQFSVGEWEGCWSISAQFPGWTTRPPATETVNQNLSIGLNTSLDTHADWWERFWGKSTVQVPDEILQSQWERELYKFGSAARQGAPPISLQAVWTADNGKLPPWKGDFHHDLNTQLSYWPAYSGNHLEEETGFLDWLWKYRETFKKYTRNYFEAEGLNVPGVTTLTGEPMGGWIQYSFGPTVSSWLAQHFYLHWRYSMDREFLEQRAYPWIRDVATYLDAISMRDKNGLRKLPISSSPEIHNNSREAWFEQTTNFDLALIRWTYEKAAELAWEIGREDEAQKWETILAEWPDFAIDASTGLMFAPGAPYDQSHRHFSHLMAYHPLGLIDISKGEKYRQIIENTISTLDEVGSDEWVGYSFSWLGNLKARAFDGEGAAEILRIFATSFCLPNSFHVNGDQSGKGYTNFTYRPFTLEGNFAFASGLQEMLMQSHTGIVQIFPAVPEDWNNIGFENLRTEGAFLVSAKKEDGLVKSVTFESTKGGKLRFKNPFAEGTFECSHAFQQEDHGVFRVQTDAGDQIEFKMTRE